MILEYEQDNSQCTEIHELPSLTTSQTRFSLKYEPDIKFTKITKIPSAVFSSFFFFFNIKIKFLFMPL